MKNNIQSSENMILSDKFGTVDPIIGCQLPRIIVCLNSDILENLTPNIQNLIAHCETHLSERYSGCIITILATSPKEISLPHQSYKTDQVVIKVDLYNIFNIVNGHYYNEHQVSIEVNAAIKRFDSSTITTNTTIADLINNKLSKMLVIANLINNACEGNVFKDGESFNCLDLKGNPLIFNRGLISHNVDLGYAIFDSNGNILSVLHESIAPNEIFDFLNNLSEMQDSIESHYSKFMSSKVVSILKGNGTFSDCKDPDYAKEVCLDLLVKFKSTLLSIIPDEQFCKINNFEKLIDSQFKKSIEYAIMDFTSEIQDFCRLRD